MATVWLLDVDGVVNADRPGWHMAPFTRTVYADRPFKLRWGPPLIPRLRRLHQDGAVELRWCTTWCPWAHLLEQTWGLPELVRTLTDEACGDWSPGRVDAAKTNVARAVLAAGDRLIWTDDTAVPSSGPVRDELERGGRSLLIRPAARRGLRPAHMDEIEAFARA